jgi:hypothetical protein
VPVNSNVGRHEDHAVIDTVLGWLWKLLSLARYIRVTAHLGRLSDRGLDCCFVTVRNLSPYRKAVVTEVWFQVQDRIPVLNNERPLPKVIAPEEVWETWIPLQALPEHIRAYPETLARIKLSDGKTFGARTNPDVSPAGHVPA